MPYSVPQYIDVEDKVAGPFTAKQLGWMFAMGATLLVLWGLFEPQAFWMLAIPTVLIFVALAFYRPQGRSLVAFIGSMIYFLFRPKVYFWQRPVPSAKDRISSGDRKKMEESKGFKVRKQLDAQDLEGFAQVLDTEGMEKSARIAELLEKRSLSKK